MDDTFVIFRNYKKRNINCVDLVKQGALEKFDGLKPKMQ